MGKVWFVGAGPGAPDLITVRGARLLCEAGAILYTGSLVAETVLQWATKECEIADSKSMDLEQVTAWLLDRAQRHETVVRLQTGDPTLYGVLAELARPLDEAGIPVGIVSGVSSAMASAAAAGECLTLPEITQTVIFTRLSERTQMPEGESLTALAAHGCTLCIFLSIERIEAVVAHLTEAGWAHDRPGGGRAQGDLARRGTGPARHPGRHRRALPRGRGRASGTDPGQPGPGRTRQDDRRPAVEAL